MSRDRIEVPVDMSMIISYELGTELHASTSAHTTYRCAHDHLFTGMESNFSPETSSFSISEFIMITAGLCT